MTTPTIFISVIHKAKVGGPTQLYFNSEESAQKQLDSANQAMIKESTISITDDWGQQFCIHTQNADSILMQSLPKAAELGKILQSGEQL